MPCNGWERGCAGGSTRCQSPRVRPEGPVPVLAAVPRDCGATGTTMAPGARATPKGVHWQQAFACLLGCFYLGWKGMTQRDLLHINDAY